MPVRAGGRVWVLCLISGFHLFQGDCSCVPRCRSTARSGSLSNSTTPTRTPLKSLSTSTTMSTTWSRPTASQLPMPVSLLFFLLLKKMCFCARKVTAIIHELIDVAASAGGNKTSSSHFTVILKVTAGEKIGTFSRTNLCSNKIIFFFFQYILNYLEITPTMDKSFKHLNVSLTFLTTSATVREHAVLAHLWHGVLHELVWIPHCKRSSLGNMQ